jgi:hypothetical protein
MTNIFKLINQIAIAEAQLSATQFLGPCVKGGRVRTRVPGWFTPLRQSLVNWKVGAYLMLWMKREQSW